MSRTCNHVGTKSRISASRRTADTLSLAMDREDVAHFVRSELSREERLVVMLRYAEQLQFDEIAGIMCLPQNQIESIHDKIVTRIERSLKKRRSGKRERCLAAV